MTPAQMLAHCSAGIEMAAGRCVLRALVGRVIDRAVKRVAFRDEEPFGAIRPTSAARRNRRHGFEAERKRLNGLVDNFVTTGPSRLPSSPCFLRAIDA